LLHVVQNIGFLYQKFDEKNNKDIAQNQSCNNNKGIWEIEKKINIRINIEVLIKLPIKAQ
jgi:hypothetical protein